MNNNTPLPRWLWVIAQLGGVVLILLGLTSILFPFFAPTAFAAAGVVAVGYGMIAAVLGISLLASGTRGQKQRQPKLFYSRWGWIGFLLASIAVAVAGLLLPAEMQLRPIFAPFHFLLIVLPGLLLLALVSLAAGKGAALSLRQTSLALAGGASSIFLALPVEIVGLLISGVVGVGLSLGFPGGPEEVQRLLALLEQWTARPPTDEMEILGVLASPVVLIILALTLGVVTPLIEEFGKTLVMGLVGFWIQPSLTASFVWGAACGMGFAWLEGVSNGALGLGGAGAWLGSAGVRFFATAMHAVTSGVVGLGWARFWRGHRWGLLIAYGVAAVFHGLWNLNVILTLGGVGLMLRSPRGGGLVVIGGVVMQFLLVIVALSALVGIPLLLRQRNKNVQTQA
ncbi:MAG: hypothetical protein ACP5HS_09385 [Anaerolineae bacterium]